jgi:ABC-type branched-subunit amino acid transport system ATPase component
MRVEVENLSKRFGGLKALDRVSLVAMAGEVTAIIGPNGAGKSTFLNCITGVARIDEGSVFIDGVPLPSNPIGKLVDLGITRTFQNIRLFESLTTLEHLMLARHALRDRAKSRLADDHARSVNAACMGILDRVGLRERANAWPSELSYGERRRLEIARGMAIEPRLLLLDEPAAGSTRSEQITLANLISSIAASGTAVILVEHHMDLVARVAKNIVVLNFGQVLMTGDIKQVRSHPDVIAAYLGTSVH